MSIYVVHLNQLGLSLHSLKEDSELHGGHVDQGFLHIPKGTTIHYILQVQGNGQIWQANCKSR